MNKIRTKIVAFAILCCIIVGLLIGSVATFSINSITDGNSKVLDNSLRNNYDMTIKSEVQTVKSLLQDLYSRSRKGEFSLDEAKKRGADLVRNLRYNNDGYFCIDTVEGINVVLPTDKAKKVEGTNRYDIKDEKGNYFIHDFISKGLKGGGYTDYWFIKIGATVPLPIRSYSLAYKPFNWIISTGNYVDDIDNTILKYKQETDRSNAQVYLIMFIAVAISIVIAVVLSLIMGFKLSKPILSVTELVNRTSNFDLVYDQSFEPLLKNKDEIGVMAKAIFEMRDALRQMTNNMISISNTLTSQSIDLSTTSEESVKTLDQIVVTINELAAGNSSQAEMISNTNQKISDVATTINEVNIVTSENAESAAQSLDMVAAGDNAVKVQSERMDENISVSSEVGESIQELSEMIVKVGNIIDVINSIASQTNLLALNAAIEAARAGEAGKGFAVVSDEIRKLAIASTTAAKEISQIVNNTIAKSKLAVDNIDKIKQIVTAQEESLTVTKQAFLKIKLSVEGIADKTRQAAERLYNIDSMSRELSEKSQDMATVAEQSAASTEEISASSEEQLASFELVAKASSDLSKMAENLSKEVSKFKTK